MAYSIGNRSDENSQHAFAALKQSAETLVEENSDYWLWDFLHSKDSPRLRTATSYLVQAIRENQVGEPDYALSSARRAAQLFAATSKAGNLRARFEQVYALHRMSHGTDCLAAAQRLQHTLKTTRYSWLRIQTSFEKSVCKGLTGDSGGSFSEAENALALSRRFGFRTLALRGLGFLAELKATNGNDDEAWKLTRQGLSIFLSENFPSMRGYQFYAGIAFSAESHKQWFLASALNREATSFVEKTGNISIEAMAHYRLAGDALMAGDRGLAADEFSKSNLLFAKLPQTQAWNAYRAYGQLVLAGLNAQKNQLSSSRSLLLESKRTLTALSDIVVRLNYLQIEGDLNMRTNQLEAAEASYDSALTIGRTWLAQLQSDRDRLAWSAQMINTYRALTGLYATHDGDPAKALQVWEEYRSAAVNLIDSGANQRRPNEWLNRLRESLTDRTLLTFVQFEDGIGIWVVDDRGLRFRWQPIGSLEMEKKTTRFRLLCSDPGSNTDDLQRLARELYSLLVQPIEGSLDPGRVLVIERDASIAGVPFSALQDNTGHYLVEKFSSVFSPGIGFERAFEHQKGLSLLRLHALIAAPSANLDSSSDLLPLKDAVLESQDIARHFKSRTLLSGNDATLAQFNVEIARSGVFQFSGHAVLRNDAIGLVFSQGRTSETANGPALLSAQNVEKGSSHQLRLVVLAACSTAAGPESDAMARSSLVDGFLRTAVPHVIGMGWDIDSSTTRITMNGFYAALEADDTVPGAIRTAQLLLFSNRQTRHPYYWAEVAAFGSS